MDIMEKVKALPPLPGCYLFKNETQEIIYIGKSKSLKNRVSQYFRHGKEEEYATHPRDIQNKYKNKYKKMVKEITDLDYIVTETETDALLLECNLIKQHRPKYNRQLKEDQKYLFIKITTDEQYPALFLDEKREDDGAECFGSFYSQRDGEGAMALINHIWHTPLCNQKKFKANGRVCFNYHMKRCCGPCEQLIDEQAYKEKIKEIVKCLQGDTKRTASRIKKEMLLASQALNFEKAAGLRDCIAEIEKLKRKARRLDIILKNKDVYVFLRAFHEQTFSIFFVRDGIVLHRARFQQLDTLDEQKLQLFIDDIQKENFNTEACVPKIVQGIHTGCWAQDELSVCLLEIYADKLYIHASKRMHKETRYKKLKKGFEEFTMKG